MVLPIIHTFFAVYVGIWLRDYNTVVDYTHLIESRPWCIHRRLQRQIIPQTKYKTKFAVVFIGVVECSGDVFSNPPHP